MITFETRIWVPAPLDQVWDFFANPRNLAQLTPKYLNAEIESGSVIRDDSTVVITLKPWGYPLGIKWVSKIHEVTAQGNERKFIDVQASGPFSHWKHTHVFSAGATELTSASGKSVQAPHGGTWIIDHVEYELPLGLLGKIAEKLFNRRQMQTTFCYRHDELRREFKAE